MGAQQPQEDPLKRMREKHPALFNAIELRRRQLPPQKKTPALKALLYGFLVLGGGYAGGKLSQPAESVPPMQSGFSNTMPYAPLLESRPNAFATEDRAGLDALVDSVTAEDRAAREALAQAFLENYQDALKANKDAFAKYGTAQIEMGAFYNAMRKNNIDIGDKAAVAKALRDEKIVADAFSVENFPGFDEEKLQGFGKEFIETFAGKEV